MANVSSSNSQGVHEPKLRFPGFEGEYRTVALGDISVKVVRTDPNSKAPVMMISAASGFINQSVKYSRENAGQSLKKYTLLKRGELAYNHGASKLRQFGCCFELKEAEARIPYVYHTFSISKSEFAPYIALLLNNPIMDRQLKRMVSSSVRMDGLLNISFDEYMSIKLRVPALIAEQEKIYAFVELLDQRIEKQRQLVEALKSYKRGALSKLFPQKGETAPKYRFAGFTEPWEQRKLDAAFDFSVSNNTLSRAELNYEGGKVKSVHYGDVLIKYGSVLDAQLDEIPFITGRRATDYSGQFLQDGDIIFADTAEDETTGKAAEIRHLGAVPVVSGLHTIVCRPIEKMAPYYLGYYLNSDSYRQQLFPLMQGIKVLSLNRSNLVKTDIIFPKSQKEQRQIGSFFHTLDHLITLHQHKLEDFNALRSGMLQQLFI